MRAVGVVPFEDEHVALQLHVAAVPSREIAVKGNVVAVRNVVTRDPPGREYVPSAWHSIVSEVQDGATHHQVPASNLAADVFRADGIFAPCFAAAR